jgi:outer membrane protein OmpA-like peptidoglycan-associated protein
MVVSAIRNEIRNSRDMMVEALYPITGRLVSAAVANAFRELVVVLQQRIDAVTSARQWRWRARAWMTGRPVSEIALAEAGGFRINRLLLIERGSGRLLASWHTAPESDQAPELLGGMIAAITDFSVHALSGAGELRTLDFGGREVVLRASPRTIVAAECAGVLTPESNAKIDEAFLKLVDGIDHGRPVDEAVLANLADALRPADVASQPSRASVFVLGGIATAAAAAMVWLATLAVLNWRFETRVSDALAAVTASTPALQAFPFNLEFNHARGTVILRGVHPAAADPDRIVAPIRLAASPYRLEALLAPVIAPPQLSAAERALARRTESATAGLQSKVAELEASLQAMKAIEADAKSLAARLAGIEARAAAPEARLARFIATAAIFFGYTDHSLDTAAARRVLDEAADILRGNDLRLRVVGFADSSGGAEGNLQLSRKRAEAVAAAIAERGVERSRLVVVSRGATMPIIDARSPASSANRRVVFEHVFSAESEP